MIPNPAPQLQQCLPTPQFKARMAFTQLLKVAGHSERHVDLLARVPNVEPRELAFLEGGDGARREAQGRAVEVVGEGEGVSGDGDVYVCEASYEG